MEYPLETTYETQQLYASRMVDEPEPFSSQYFSSSEKPRNIIACSREIVGMHVKLTGVDRIQQIKSAETILICRGG